MSTWNNTPKFIKCHICYTCEILIKCWLNIDPLSGRLGRLKSELVQRLKLVGLELFNSKGETFQQGLLY